MSIEVRFSGRYKDLVGVESFVIDASEIFCVGDVVVEVIFEFSDLQVDKSRIMVFRNGMNLSYDEQVSDGDVLVFAPPLVSGG